MITDKKEQIFHTVHSAIQMIEKNLKNNVQLPDVTSAVGASHWEFQRLFKSIVGISIGQYLRNRKLTESLSDLKKPHLRVLDVAMEYNFASQESFARAFKAYFGFTPMEYRDHESKVVPRKMDQIELADIHYFWDGIQRIPDILSLEEKILVGRKIKFKTHFDIDSDCADKVVPLWLDFAQQLKTISHRAIRQELYGVAISSGMEMKERELEYMAAIPVTTVSTADYKDYESLLLPSGLYAKFEKKGLADKMESLIDYIYGIWLTTSEYQRRPGYDFEFFDQRYNLNNPDSISYFLIPIEPKKTKINI